uniref:Guanylate cyclase activator 2B n=1 Tax=Strix occidentalis caurina TaxID=311401 RepID=A0A8D0F534_STROC
IFQPQILWVCLMGVRSDGDLKFSLESVKKLKELMDENRHIHHRMVVPMSSYSPCHEKDLPEEFQSVCKREDASMIFERLMILELAACGRCTCLMKMGASWLLKCSDC